MRRPIVVPELRWPAPAVSLWYVRPGEAVYAGDRVVEILLGGAVVELSAPCTGRLREWLAWPGDTVAAGQVVGTIDAEEDNDL